MQYYSTETESWITDYEHPATGRTYLLIAVKIGDQYSACVDETAIGSNHKTFDAATRAAQAWVDQNASTHQPAPHHRHAVLHQQSSSWPLRALAFVSAALVPVLLNSGMEDDRGVRRLQIASATITKPAPDLPRRRPITPAAIPVKTIALINASESIQFLGAPKPLAAAETTPSPNRDAVRITNDPLEYGNPYVPPVARKLPRVKSKQRVAKPKLRYRKSPRKRRVVVGHRRCRIRGKSEWCRVYRTARAQSRRSRRRARQYRRISQYRGPIMRSRGSYWRRCQVRGKSEWCRIRR